jgi:hypothetical protein
LDKEYGETNFKKRFDYIGEIKADVKTRKEKRDKKGTYRQAAEIRYACLFFTKLSGLNFCSRGKLSGIRAY